MSTKLPTISVTADAASQSESSESDSYSNDMDYGLNNGEATDVEDFDSQTEAVRQRSPRPSHALTLPSNTQNDLTDIEDYNDSGSDEEEKSRNYPELKISLQEFLEQGLQAQALINNESGEKVEMRAGNFLQAQNLNGDPDYLTDCEDYNTDSEIEYGCDKSVCLDLDTAVGDQGKVAIADKSKPTKHCNEDSDEYEDVSVLSDISDLMSAMSDATGAGIRGMSEDELLEISGNEEECQIAYSGSSFESEDENAAARQCELPDVNVAFVAPIGHECLKFKPAVGSKKSFLTVSKQAEEVLTDVEKLDDSAAEEDSFDNEEENEKPIPRAVIFPTGDDNVCVTDTEDIACEDNYFDEPRDVQPVTEKALPPPHREVVMLKEDKYGDTITNVMPMDREFQFGLFNNLKEDNYTDSEDYSCVEDCESHSLFADEVLTPANALIEGDVTVLNEVLKPVVSKRLELQANAEPVTDVEEIYVAGTNRRKKLKTRSMSKGKNKFLDIVPKGKEDGHTDVEDMELSDSGFPTCVKPVLDEPLKDADTDKVTDVEDMSGDDISDASDAPLINSDKSNLRDYLANSANIVVTLEKDAKDASLTLQNTRKLQTLRLSLQHDEPGNQQHTDVEDMQAPSDTDGSQTASEDKNSICNCSELTDMLNESCTVVHEKSCNAFNIDAEKLHIKGMCETRDAHTDVEYVESDESIARGNN